MVTAKGENFLLFDSGPGATRIIIFGTQQNVDILTSFQIWLADGTFKTLLRCSHKYTLFTVCVEVQTLSRTAIFYSVSLFYCLIRQSRIIMDFERAAIDAFQAEWPTTTVKGCFFHFTQNIWRKLQALGLKHQYIHDEHLALQLNTKLCSTLRIPTLADHYQAEGR